MFRLRAHFHNNVPSCLWCFQVKVRRGLVPVLNWLGTKQRRRMGGMDECTHVFLTSVLVGHEWSASRSSLFTPKDHPVPTLYKVGWTPEPIWSTRENGHPWPYRDSNSNPSVIQPVVNRYTDWAIVAQSVFHFRCYSEIWQQCLLL
jgi:hypothetical protein